MLRLTAAIALLVACGDDGAVPMDAHGDAIRDDAPVDSALTWTCPTGMTLVADRTSCPTTTVQPPNLSAESPQPGDVISLHGLNEGTLPCAPTLVCAPAGSATLVFSDDPETPSTNGVLYADTVGPGRIRVYIYHVNASASARKFSLVALAPGATDVHATFVKESLTPPGTDYLTIGRQTAAAWMQASTTRALTIPAGQRVLMSPQLDALHPTTNQLVNAIFDIDLDGPAKLSVVSVLATDDAVALTASLPLLAYDGMHDRGTFPNADQLLAVHVGGEGPSARHVRLGSNVTEPDLAGRDATRSVTTTLRGNYGVAYTFEVTTSDQLQLVASARGGAWGGAFRNQATTSNLGPLDDTASAIWLGSTADFHFDGTTTSFQLMSAGGSNLPVDIAAFTH